MASPMSSSKCSCHVLGASTTPSRAINKPDTIFLICSPILLSDNNISRYRQLELPIRKENIEPMQAARSALSHEKSSLGSGPPSCVLWRKKLRVPVFTRHPRGSREDHRSSHARSSSNANCPHSKSSDNYKGHLNAKHSHRSSDNDTSQCSDNTNQRGHRSGQMPW